MATTEAVCKLTTARTDFRKILRRPTREPRAVSRLKITYKDPADLKPRANNPRTHSPRQINQIAASIKTFGFIAPVLIDSANGIVAGHGRVAAAKKLGMTDIPTVRVDHLTPGEIRAYVIADNRLAENAGWDRKLLAIELEELSLDLNFDVTVTGFETGEIDFLITEQNDDEPDPVDEVPDVDRSKPAVSRLGDCWRLGDHVLVCGDALKPETFRRLLGKQKAQMVFVDPPYNVAIAGHASGLGKAKHREFEMASGEMSSAQYTRFLTNAFSRLAEFSINGSIHFVCIDWRHLRELMDAGDAAYDELKNLCVWNKTNAGMGSFYRSQHELIFVFKNGTASISTISNLAGLAAIAATPGPTRVPMPSARSAMKSLRCTPRSSRWRSSLMQS